MDAATSKAPVPLFTVVVVAHVPVAGAAGPAGTHVLELPERSKGGTAPGVLATANDPCIIRAASVATRTPTAIRRLPMSRSTVLGSTLPLPQRRRRMVRHGLSRILPNGHD